ncbi:MAG: vanadium-dependent haloperoxidase [Cytophagaceae bacterium]|nr:vanadium-dependent haloperoxidase [Gemmatimonadaceae bacterium]
MIGALLLAACQDSTSLPTVPTTPMPAVQDVQVSESGASVAWNLIARDLVKKYTMGAAPAIRVYALVSTAQHQAVTTAGENGGNPVRASESAAAAGASAAVLTYLFPSEAPFLEGKVDEQEQTPFPGSEGKSFSAGEQIGRTIAVNVIEDAKGDRFFTPFTGTVPTCPGCWLAVPTPPAFATLGQARTFFLTTGNQFRPPPPPAFGSPAFVADLAEVRRISDTRTPVQDSIAKFWSLQGGTVTPLGYWNEVAAGLIAKYSLNERRAARTLAVMNMAGYDAIVASHEAKYVYWLIRPTQADPNITLPIALPSFPAYPSNHAAISAAAATVLGDVFPAERSKLLSQAEQAAISRIYGGIHYRFDATAGVTLGKKIGRLALDIGPKGTK